MVLLHHFHSQHYLSALGEKSSNFESNNSPPSPSSLTRLDSAAFVHLTNLKSLVLDGNPIQKLDPKTSTAIMSLPALQELSLKECSLKFIPDGFLLNFRHLERLDISANFFTEIEDDLQHNNRLRELDVSENPFKVSVLLCNSDSVSCFFQFSLLQLRSVAS